MFRRASSRGSGAPYASLTVGTETVTALALACAILAISSCWHIMTATQSRSAHTRLLTALITVMTLGPCTVYALKLVGVAFVDTGSFITAGFLSFSWESSLISTPIVLHVTRALQHSLSPSSTADSLPVLVNTCFALHLVTSYLSYVVQSLSSPTSWIMFAISLLNYVPFVWHFGRTARHLVTSPSSVSTSVTGQGRVTADYRAARLSLAAACGYIIIAWSMSPIIQLLHKATFLTIEGSAVWLAVTDVCCHVGGSCTLMSVMHQMHRRPEEASTLLYRFATLLVPTFDSAIKSQAPARVDDAFHCDGSVDDTMDMISVDDGASGYDTDDISTSSAPGKSRTHATASGAQMFTLGISDYEPVLTSSADGPRDAIDTGTHAVPSAKAMSFHAGCPALRVPMTETRSYPATVMSPLVAMASPTLTRRGSTHGGSAFVGLSAEGPVLTARMIGLAHVDATVASS